jgi:hypothetical protein
MFVRGTECVEFSGGALMKEDEFTPSPKVQSAVLVLTGTVAVLILFAGVWIWVYWWWKAPAFPIEDSGLQEYRERVETLNAGLGGVVDTVVVNILLPLFSAIITSVLAFILGVPLVGAIQRKLLKT